MSATLPKKRACGSAKAAADGRSASARARARRPVTLASAPASIAAREPAAFERFCANKKIEERGRCRESRSALEFATCLNGCVTEERTVAAATPMPLAQADSGEEWSGAGGRGRF
eukprot:scaffold72170_cov40-Phaeocystis_antarctica.AAC.1